MELTRRQIDRLVATQPGSLEAMRRVKGWAGLADTYVSLRDYQQGVAQWSERKADEYRARHREFRDRFVESKTSALGRARRGMTSLGVDAPDGDLAELEAVWPAVLDVVEAAERESALLGSADPASGHRDELRRQGLIVEEPKTRTAKDVGREIRAALLQAIAHQREIDLWEAKAEAVDAYAVDQQEVGWLNAWGRIPYPHDENARPTLPDWVLPTMRAAGVDLDEALSGRGGDQ